MSEEVIATYRSLTGAKGKAEAFRLGGLTNRVYRIDANAGCFVLRLPGEGTEAYIDRKVEARNANAAACAGVSPDVLRVDVSRGLMLTRFVEGRTMTPELFRSVAGAPARAARAFKTLHESGETFAFRFELFAMIDNYLALLSDLGADLPDGYHDVLAKAESVRAALVANPAPLAPCHCDPLCENFIDTGERMWLVDWEYSGMNDPLWDLGDLSVEAAFGAEQDEEMLAAYFGRQPTAVERGRVVIYISRPAATLPAIYPSPRSRRRTLTDRRTAPPARSGFCAWPASRS
jgi:thiamine kinase-like enzyme